MNTVRVLIADDHSVVRRGVKSLLESQRGWSVCAQASTGEEAVAQVRRLRPDVVVMDISMPGMGGLEATREIKRTQPQTEVLILSMYESEQLVRKVLQAGARGFVLKSDLDRNLVRGIRITLQGRLFLSPRLSQVMLEGQLSPVAAQPATSVTAPLTPRQREVVRLLAEGKTSKEVASALGITVKTAETHRMNIRRVLGLKTTSELVRYAVRERIVEP